MLKLLPTGAAFPGWTRWQRTRCRRSSRRRSPHTAPVVSHADRQCEPLRALRTLRQYKIPHPAWPHFCVPLFVTLAVVPVDTAPTVTVAAPGAPCDASNDQIAAAVRHVRRRVADVTRRARNIRVPVEVHRIVRREHRAVVPRRPGTPAPACPAAPAAPAAPWGMVKLSRAAAAVPTHLCTDAPVPGAPVATLVHGNRRGRAVGTVAAGDTLRTRRHPPPPPATTASPRMRPAYCPRCPQPATH